MRLSSYLFVLISLALVLTSCGQKKKENKKFEIAYLSNRASKAREFNIFVSDNDGKNLKNLTEGRSDVRPFSAPKFSSDQNYMFYTSDQGVKGKYLNVIDLKKDTIKSITSLMKNNSRSIFSEKIGMVFFIDKVDGLNRIFSIDLTGDNRKIITKSNLDIEEFDINEKSKSIVYSARIGNSISLFTTDFLGTKQIQLTDSKGDDINPKYSSDGQKIIFSSSRNKNKKNDFDIYIINQNGENLHVVYDSDYYNSQPKFSPKENAIAFLSNRRGMKFRDILYMDLDSDKKKNLTSSLGTINQNFSFSPDGYSIVFENIKTINADIYLVNIDTDKIINISNDPSWDVSPTL